MTSHPLPFPSENSQDRLRSTAPTISGGAWKILQNEALLLGQFTLSPSQTPPCSLALGYFNVFLTQSFPATQLLSYCFLCLSLPSPSSLLATSFQIIQMSETLGRLLMWALIHLRSVSVMNLFTDLPSFQTFGEQGELLTHLGITGV